MKIDGHNIPVIFYETILDAANRADIYIPVLCKDPGFKESGGRCRLCTVEITQQGKKWLASACETIATEDMEIKTKTEAIKRARKMVLQLLNAEAPDNEKILELMKKSGANLKNKIPIKKSERTCIHCNMCVIACKTWAHGAIEGMHRGIKREVNTPYRNKTNECIGCASCELVCPINVIKVSDYDNYRKIWNNEFELLYCEKCGKLLTTKNSYEEAYYDEAPVLCHECSEEYRKKHRHKEDLYNF